MSHSEFVKKVREHLAGYMPVGGVPGTFNGRTYSHIVKIPGKGQKDAIEAILRSDGMEEVGEFRNPHRYAHHLNSSQVLCYEFFRPLLKKVGDTLVAKDSEMQKVLGAMGLPAGAFLGAKAEFEKEFDDGEGTNFDFYLESEDGKSRLFVEVKYTEQGFGTCVDNRSHRDKFERTYLGMLRGAPCLNDSAHFMTRHDFPVMRKYYQLFRNTVRVLGENDYVVFLYPGANTIAEYQFDTFRERFVADAKSDHVLKVHLEDLGACMGERFREKFFGY